MRMLCFLTFTLISAISSNLVLSAGAFQQVVFGVNLSILAIGDGRSKNSDEKRRSYLGSSASVSIETSPIEGMRAGTSGLRKKVEVWQEKGYVENFIQSLLNAAKEGNNGEMLHTVIVAGDGRYYNRSYSKYYSRTGGKWCF